MNELERHTWSTSQKEATKQWLKQQMARPYDSPARRHEIDQMVEYAGQCADFIEETAKLCGVDLDEFVVRLFGMK